MFNMFHQKYIANRTTIDLLLNLAAKILIIIELYKSFDDFSVVCGDIIRSFVAILFGRL